MLSDRASAVLGRRDRMVVLGVLNVTPDSFSDGGRYCDVAAAVAHAEQMVAEGADVIDVGGESTRPGARRVSAEEEARRVVPVIAELSRRDIAVSVDTYRAEVAELSLSAGALIVNDVSGGLGDPKMAAVVRDARCPWILMHWRGHSETMAALAVYADVVGEVRAELTARVDAAVAAGVEADQLIIDPGIGFAKSAAHNWALLANLDALSDLGLPMLIAASRKSFLGTLLTDSDGQPRSSDAREAATIALTTSAALSGAWGVRVHEVRGNVDAAIVAATLHRYSARQ
jgi:dihydropteroate synthase